MIDRQAFLVIMEQVKAAGHEGDITWSENVQPPADAQTFAHEAIFVIANSGMHHSAGRAIYERVVAKLDLGRSAHEAFGHKGKADAMDHIWRERGGLYVDFVFCRTDQERLDFCGRLPWIGGITKYHLAKNFGVNVAKPDRHLQRLADRAGCTPQELCDQLAAVTGYRAATVDVVLWRACAIGIVDSRA